MKALRILPFLLLFSSLSTTDVSAQKQWKNSLPIQLVKNDIGALFLRTISLKYERVMSENISFQIGGAFTLQKGELWEGLEGEFYSYSITPQARMYLRPYDVEKAKRIAPIGVYIGIWGKYEDFSLLAKIGGEQAEILTGYALGGGLQLGWQFWVQKTIMIDAYVGEGFK